VKFMRHILSTALLLALAACGGGASTSVNPLTAPPSVPDYTGLAPRSADVQSFRLSLWNVVRDRARCGGCHNETSGQAPQFARGDDVNLAYDAALQIVNLAQADQSRMVVKVAGGHNCWVSSNQACVDIITNAIKAWSGSSGGGVTQIQLQAPNDIDVRTNPTLSFPTAAADAGTNGASFANTIWPLVRGAGNCVRCHSPGAGTPQSPFFASADVDEAYAAARSKINLDTPTISRLVVRLRQETHNCWSGNCANDADAIQTQIDRFIAGITPTVIDPRLQVSRALTLYDGTVAAGGSRFEAFAIAKYQFKERPGTTTAFDTSGVEPALNLTVSGNADFIGGWGVLVKAGAADSNVARERMAGKAQGTTTASKKIADRIKQSGEYSIELWAAPANVSQEDSYLFSYSGGVMARNVTIGQRAYQYEVLARSSTTGANGAPALLTRDADRDAQAALQHIVLNYDPVNGRQLYVNGNPTGDADPRAGGSLADWDDTFSLVLGNETSNNRQWQGVIRFAAVHERKLTAEQIQQNFVAGVGEKYFLLFNVSALTGKNQTYVMFEVSEYDSYSYLFNKPSLISLDPAMRPGSFSIKGMRIGVNGAEAISGQAYANLNATVSDANYSPANGQLLAEVGTIVARQKGPIDDRFFLTFDDINGNLTVRTPDATPVLQRPDLPMRPDIGVRTFEQLNQSMSRITGMPTTTPAVRTTYLQLQQQLPPVPNIQAFLASHQTGVAQLAIKYCAAMVDSPAASLAFFGSNISAADLSTTTGKNAVINPLLARIVGANLSSQPADADVSTELGLLIDKLRTRGAASPTIIKGTCAAALGSGVLSIL
jgi:hypothetical protein